MNHERALAIASQPKERIEFTTGIKAMECTAGMGLLSFALCYSLVNDLFLNGAKPFNMMIEAVYRQSDQFAI